MQQWILQVMSQYGAWGIFALIFLENVFPPIPSEVILAFGGFLTLQTTLTVPTVILAATLGSVAGAVVLYGIGYGVGEARLIQFVRKYGAYLGVKERNVQKAMICYQRYQKRTVFFCRMMPIVRSLISVPAGMANMPMAPFLLLTTIGSALWNTVLVLAGRALGHAWSGIAAFMGTYSTMLWILLAVLFIVWYVRKKRNAGHRARHSKKQKSHCKVR